MERMPSHLSTRTTTSIESKYQIEQLRRSMSEYHSEHWRFLRMVALSIAAALVGLGSLRCQTTYVTSMSQEEASRIWPCHLMAKHCISRWGMPVFEHSLS